MMAKIKRNQDDLDQMKEIFSMEGMQISDKVKKDISDLLEKELGKGKGKGKAFKKGGRVKAKGMAAGGAVMPMGKDPKTGKQVPKFAMDGVGKMAKGGRVKAKGMAMGGKVKAKGMAMGGKVKAKGMAMGGKVKSKGMAMGGKIKSKGYALGGSIKSKGAAMGGAGFGAARSSGKAIVTY